MKKRIKHNDLIPWFTMDHGQLPAAYLKSTKKFFQELEIRQAASPQAGKLDKSTGKL
jgi:hypothetical protein